MRRAPGGSRRNIHVAQRPEIPIFRSRLRLARTTSRRRLLAVESLGFAPHLAGDLNYQPQLLRLLLDGDVVAFDGAREATLG
jgi:hypothetical protein